MIISKIKNSVIYTFIVILYNSLRYGFYDINRFIRNNRYFLDTDKKLELLIIQGYHSIEKGICMPDRRLGFGKDASMYLISNIIKYITLYGNKSDQVRHAVVVLHDYFNIHKKANFLIDDKLNKLYQELCTLGISINSTAPSQLEIDANDYFASANECFEIFSTTRHSVRNFSSKKVNMDLINKSISLALNAPSACNRQSSRIHVFTNKQQINDILLLQGGSRGFGHLADNLILVTSDISGFDGVRERNAPYIDGGIFGMNLMYALHYYRLGACALNCSFDIKSDFKMRKLTSIPDSEVFIMMLLVGHVPSKFMINASTRFKISDIMTVYK